MKNLQIKKTDSQEWSNVDSANVYSTMEYVFASELAINTVDEFWIAISAGIIEVGEHQIRLDEQPEQPQTSNVAAYDAAISASLAVDGYGCEEDEY